jgi:hypothetical protein
VEKVAEVFEADDLRDRKTKLEETISSNPGTNQ